MITLRTRLARWMVVTAIVGVGLLWTAPGTSVTTAFAQQPPAQSQPSAPRPPAATDEFVPVSEIPESDKLPAAPFLIGAYTVAWLAILLYLWSLWRRLSRVEEELKRLQS